MPAIKVCGICNIDDAEKSAELGAAYLGLIFAESARQVSLAEARQIRRKLKDRVKFVGVFRNQDWRFINDTAEVVGLDFVQMHGQESADDCRQINYPVIKAIELSGKSVQAASEELAGLADYTVHAFLFDRPKSMAGDDGWLKRIVEFYGDKLPQFQPFFIAGGLSADNVELACSLNPFGVDLASAVEAEAGKKDHKKLEAFFQAVEGATEC